MQAIEKINICGDEILAIRDESGKGWIVVKRVCEVLGIDESSQSKKLKGQPWACTVTITAHDTTGRNQELFCLHVDDVPMWLATIQTSRVSESARPKLIRYQQEARDVLRDWAYGRITRDNRDTDVEAALVRMSDMITNAIAPLGYAVADARSQIHQVSEKVDSMGQRIEKRIESIERRLPRERVRLTESTKRFHVQIVYKTFRGRCPCCHERDAIVDGRVVGEFDHATETGKATVDHTWLVCRECNQRMSNSRESADRDAFGAYQRHVPRVIQGTIFG